MRLRDLYKLKLGTKLRVKLSKAEPDAGLGDWHNKIVYLAANALAYSGWTTFKTRSSKKVTGSTIYEHFYPKELSLVKD